MTVLFALNRFFSFVIAVLVIALGGLLFLSIAPLDGMAAEDETIIIETRSDEGLPRSSLYEAPPLPDVLRPTLATKVPFFQINGLSHTDLSEPVAVLNFFAVWCPDCAREMPFLQELSRRYDVPVYGINVYGKETDDIPAFFEANGNPFKKWGKDDFGLALEGFGLNGIPLTMIVTKDRQIHWSHKGKLSAYVIEEEMMPLINWLKADAGAN